jgi:hypothetical protein
MARDALHVLGEGGVLVQFTYGVGSPVPLRGADVEVRPAPRIWRNLWPAKSGVTGVRPEPDAACQAPTPAPGST